MKMQAERVLSYVLIVVFTMGMANVASAGKKGKLDGKELYKNNCKVCHDKNAKAGEYTPMSLIVEQWDRFFDETYESTHKTLDMPVAKDAKAKTPAKKVTEAITAEMLKAIRKFSTKHAADSEHPMTCG